MGLSTKLSDEELPLKFEEIVDVKTYDKMRPPRPGGMPSCHHVTMSHCKLGIYRASQKKQSHRFKGNFRPLNGRKSKKARKQTEIQFYLLGIKQVHNVFLQSTN